MAVSAQRVTVGATAVALNSTGTAGDSLTIKNLDATNGVDLGPSSVTAGPGFPLAPGATVTVEVDPVDVLFATRPAAADVVLAVLRT